MNARLPAGVLARADFPMLRLIHIHRLQPAFDRVSLLEAYTRRCVLFRHEGRFIAVREDPLAVDVQRWVEASAGDAVEWYLVTPQDLTDWLKKQAEVSSTLHNILKQAQASAGRTVAESVKMPAKAPVFAIPTDRKHEQYDQLVHANIHDALRLGATDIHFESSVRGLVVRLRIDGVLETTCEAGGHDLADKAIASLKRLARLDGAESSRKVRTGRFTLRLNGQPLDFSLSIVPGFHGDDAVVRVLEKRRLVPAGEVLGIEQLGFTSVDRTQIRNLATQPYGLFLVTGPSGSGTTTTLYGMLSEINDGQAKIVTVEEPVEHELPGILQVPAAAGQESGIAQALHAVLEHDPDRVMIGEIRDAATAELALQAALNGRLVFGALRVNHAFDVFSRFARFGIPPEQWVAGLNGVMSQRLLRTVCPHCAEAVVPSSRELAALGLPPEAGIGGFRRGAGCGECRTTGYKGRRAVAEILVLDDRLRSMISRHAPLDEIKAEARRQGMQSLREAALQLARAGLTTLEEVARVTQPA